MSATASVWEVGRCFALPLNHSHCSMRIENSFSRRVSPIISRMALEGGEKRRAAPTGTPDLRGAAATAVDAIKQPWKQRRNLLDMSIGRKQWAIAEGYIPPYSHGPSPQMTSHEACASSMRATKQHISKSSSFTKPEIPSVYGFDVRPRRSRHLRFNNFEDPEPIPTDTPFSSVITSNVPIVVQHTRLDSRQSGNALLSTIAFAAIVEAKQPTAALHLPN